MKNISYKSAAVSGLTLVELLVVLSILAVLSTVALRSVVGNLEQQNYEANISQLEEIKTAILGDDKAAGFLDDIGRLPRAVGTDPLTQLSELWSNEIGNLSTYSINTAPGDDEIRLGAGWRGPYLNLGLTRADLTDGFSNPYTFTTVAGNIPGDGQQIPIILSLGADNAALGIDYNEDFSIVLEADITNPNDVFNGGNPAPLNQNNWQTDLIVSVFRSNTTQNPVPTEGDRVLIRVYGANDGDLNTIGSHAFVSLGETTPLTHTFVNLPFGPKVIRAYQVNDALVPATDETPFVTRPAIISVPTNVILNRNAPVTPVELILNGPSS